MLQRLQRLQKLTKQDLGIIEQYIKQYDNISKMLNELKELKQKLEKFPEERQKEISETITLVQKLKKIEEIINFINFQRNQLSLPEFSLSIIQRSYIEEQNTLKSQTEEELKKLNLPLSSKPNDVLNILPPEIQESLTKFDNILL